jgi:UDP-N-acetyl-D-glucosamine dehydrogenase
VGLPLAVAAAGAGHYVVGYDTAPDRIERLETGLSPVEDVSDECLKHAIAAGSLRFTIDPGELRHCWTYVICVPTPLRDKAPDLSMVMSAIDTVAPNLSMGDLVILESTTYPGTTEDVVGPHLTRATGLQAGRDYHLAFSPERIDPGNNSYGISNTPKIVGGVGSRATK